MISFLGAGIHPSEITSDFTLMEYALLPWGGQGRRRLKGLRLNGKKETALSEKTGVEGSARLPDVSFGGPNRPVSIRKT